jgi:hypothetical protein
MLFPEEVGEASFHLFPALVGRKREEVACGYQGKAITFPTGKVAENPRGLRTARRSPTSTGGSDLIPIHRVDPPASPQTSLRSPQ